MIRSLSAFFPAHNEEENVERMCNALRIVLPNVAEYFEIIIVNDDYPGSETMKKLKEIHNIDPRVVLIGLTRNFGHQMALTAGIDYARGEAVVTLDGDLQHPPELILTLIDNWKKGYDIVYTIRQDVFGVLFFIHRD